MTVLCKNRRGLVGYTKSTVNDTGEEKVRIKVPIIRELEGGTIRYNDLTSVGDMNRIGLFKGCLYIILTA